MQHRQAIKQLIGLTVLVGYCLCSNAQDQLHAVKGRTTDGIVERSVIRPLAVGDKVPDVLLKKLLNYQNPQARISDFRGKLLILDFWNSTCGTCIAGFPHMELLQQEFGNKIQVLLVNTESEERILQAGKKIRLPKLPSIVEDSVLTAMFPHSLAGYHVWIDQEGVVRLKGPYVNSHAAKVAQLLAGQTISFVHEEVEYNSHKSLSALAGSVGQPIDQTGSLIIKGSDDLGQLLGGHVARGVVDEVQRTYRNTYINRDVVQLYYAALEKKIDSLRVPDRIPVNTAWPDVVLNVRDTLQFTHRFIPSTQLTDEQLLKSSFCYEQITPLNRTNEQRNADMLNDLNRYFGRQYGLRGDMQKHEMTCYALIYKPQEKRKITVPARDTELVEEEVVVSGKRMRRYRGYKLRDVVAILAHRINADRQVIWLDETGFDKGVDLIVPHEQNINTLDDLRDVLRPLGLDIVVSKRNLDMLVLTKGRYK